MDYHQKTTSLKNVPFSRDAIFQWPLRGHQKTLRTCETVFCVRTIFRPHSKKEDFMEASSVVLRSFVNAFDFIDLRTMVPCIKCRQKMDPMLD